MAQIIGSVRHTVLIQVMCRCTQNDPLNAEGSDREAVGVGQLPNPDGQLERAGHQIDCLNAEVNVHRKQGKAVGKRKQGWRNDFGA
jgi:hypothetical protein